MNQKGKFNRQLKPERERDETTKREDHHAVTQKPGLTLLYIVDKSLEFGDVFSLFSQGIKDHVIVR